MKLGPCLVLTLLTCAAAAADGPGEILATVNGEVIVRAELDRLVEGELAQLDARGLKMPEDQLMGLRRRELDHLIDNVLLAQAGRAAGIEITPAELDAEMEAFRGPAGSEGALKARLEELGLSLAEIERCLTRDLYAARYLDRRLKAAAVPGEEEIHAYYQAHAAAFRQPEAVRVRHILIAADAQAAQAEHDAARARADDLRQRLAAGEDFASVAASFSACPSAREGGDLGFLVRGQMAPEFEQAAWALNVGETSAVVKTRFGYHLIRVVEKRPAREIPLAEAEAEIAALLAREKYRTGTAAVLTELRAQANVVDGAGRPVPGLGPAAGTNSAKP